MNVQRYLIGSIAVFVFFLVVEFIFHGVILTGCYEGHIDCIRQGYISSAYIIPLLVGYLILAFGFCLIFTKGYENKGIAEGIRYGLYVAIAFIVSGILIAYAICPLSLWLAVIWIVGYLIIMILAGIIMAAIYKPR